MYVRMYVCIYTYISIYTYIYNDVCVHVHIDNCTRFFHELGLLRALQVVEGWEGIKGLHRVHPHVRADLLHGFRLDGA